MFELSSESRKALDEFCATLPTSQADLLRRAIERVCIDPSGRRQPTHRYTRRFFGAKKYVPGLSRETVWEFKTNHVRGLFIADRELRVIVFARVNGKRFFRPHECPWPH